MIYKMSNLKLCWRSPKLGPDDCIYPLDDNLRKNIKLRFKKFCVQCDVFKKEIKILDQTADGIYTLLLDLYEELRAGQEVYEKIKLSQDIQVQQLMGIAKLLKIFQTSLDVKKIVHATASVITAGQFLGFNRAFILLRDDSILKGFYAIGPRTPDEAGKIWKEIEEKRLSLEEIIEYDEVKFNKESEKFKNVLEKLKVPISEIKELMEKAPWLRIVPTECKGIFKEISEAIENSDFTLIPLKSETEIIGLIIADNPFSRIQIDESMLSKLEMIIYPASIAISRALLHKEVLDKAREQERVNQALKKYQETITQLEKIEAIGETINEIAHDIKNPATVIGGIAKSLIEDVSPEDPKFHYLKAIYDEAQELLDLINSRIKSFRKRFIEKPNWVRIEDILRRVIESKKHILKVRQIKWETQIEDTDLEFLVNPADISRCLDHVIQNAIEAMPDGGKLTIKLSKINDTSVQLQITDTGVGIDEKYREKVFEPAFTTKENGWGMGLYFCKKKLKFYDGDITLKGKIGEGVTVTIVLRNGKIHGR